MPVTTRTTIGGSAPDAQQGASSMAARGRVLDPAQEDQENSSNPNQDTKPEVSEIEKHRALMGELKNTETELADAKREYERLSTASKPKRTPKPQMAPMRQLELEDTDVRDEMPREYSMAQQMQLIGTTIASALSKDKNNSARDSLISTDSAALIACDLTVHERPGFKAKIKLQASLKEPRVRDLMDLKWETRAEFITQRDALGLKGVDAALSATIYACLKGKEEKAIVKLMMLETETDEELGASGVLLFEWIDKEGSESAFGKDEKLKAAFDAKPFFVAGVPEQDNKVMGAQLIKEIEVLPSQYTSPKYSKLALVISKIPPHLQNEFWAQKLRGDLNEVMRKGREEPWTLKELSNDIAAYCETSIPSPPSPSVSVGVNNQGVKSTAPGCCGKGAYHKFWECPNKCRTCDDHLCPATHGKTCFKDQSVRPTTDTLKNAYGSLVSKAKNSEKLIKRAQELWDKYHPGGGATANIAVTQTEDDEQPLGQQIYVNVVQ